MTSLRVEVHSHARWDGRGDAPNGGHPKINRQGDPAMTTEPFDDLMPEAPVACEGCGETYPDSALDGAGLCQECRFHHHLESQRRRDEYFREDTNPDIYEM